MQTVVFKEKMLFVMMQNMVGGSLKTFGCQNNIFWNIGNSTWVQTGFMEHPKKRTGLLLRSYHDCCVCVCYLHSYIRKVTVMLVTL